MIKFTLLAILLISHSAFAQNCASKSSEADCTALSGCQFTQSGSTCTNSCTALSQADCTNPSNSPKCSYTAATCTNTVDCTTLNAALCQANNACSYTPGSASGTCAVKNPAFTNFCQGLSSSDCQGVTGSAKCNFTAGQFTCSYKAGQCAGIPSMAHCNTAFCTATQTVCAPQLTCSTQVEGDCTAANGCNWDPAGNGGAGQCNDVCTSVTTSDADCNAAAVGCRVTTPYSCADNNITGTNTCNAAHNTADCNTAATFIGFCTGATGADTCSVKAAFCTGANTQAGCDSTLCTFTSTSASAGSCANAYDCTALQATNQCGTKSGCTSTAEACKNTDASSCKTSDDKATCSGTGKFCSYSSTGTCLASSTTFGHTLKAVSTVGSIIVALTFL